MSDVGSSLNSLVTGIDEDIRDFAKDMEELLPQYVDLGMILVTVLIWFNAVVGSCAMLTQCKCDDCLMIFIGSITILILALSVGVELTLATVTADVCYAVPEVVIMEVAGGDLTDFYLTCNGTSPFTPQFDSARETVKKFRTTISEMGEWCESTNINLISDTTNLTVASINDIEDQTGCASINPLYTRTVHGIVCDELIRGLFIALMVQAASAFLIFFALMVYPCAANTKVHTIISSFFNLFFFPIDSFLMCFPITLCLFLMLLMYIFIYKLCVLWNCVGVSLLVNRFASKTQVIWQSNCRSQDKICCLPIKCHLK
mmetsp:Transcript_15882/g.18733  ORF Transcript_15882/g.18733 Transcript_15882/m.18733 type:complete len:316 (+) Transcript_15882:595-1542(+)